LDARPLEVAALEDEREEDAWPLEEAWEEEARPLDDAFVADADFFKLADEREGVADLRLLVDLLLFPDLLLDFLLDVPEDWLRDFFIDDGFDCEK
jgi:hypothetical protein